jgi:Fe-S-cluster-containing hydrogenase component 2
MAAKVNEEKCVGCEACVDVCPIGAIEIEDSKALISNDCIECGVCASVCPQEAISL